MSTTIQFRNHSEHQTLTSIIVEALSAVPQFFVSLQKATLAAREYERLGHLSDDELNAYGLTREDLSQYISTKYLAK